MPSSAPRSRAPFLPAVWLREDREIDPQAWPFSLPALAAAPFRIDFTGAITLLVGPNGSGKSTILEALAFLCGFGRHGGNRDYAAGAHAVPEDPLGLALRGAWMPKVTRGFYTRAETISDLTGQIDEIAAEDPAILASYGGRSLSRRSHGEGVLDIYRHRIRGRGIYLFDEPEAALSPARQVEFLRLLRDAEQGGDSQFVIATHAPLLMAYPGATLLHLTPVGLVERPFQFTEHYRIMRAFYADPDSFMRDALGAP